MKKISRRSFLAAAGLSVAALALTACGGSSASTASSVASSAAASSEAASTSAAAGELTTVEAVSYTHLPWVCTFFRFSRPSTRMRNPMCHSSQEAATRDLFHIQTLLKCTV